MRILLITLEYPPQKGGITSYYFGLVEELRRQGQEVVVVTKGLLARWFWPRWLIGYFTVRKFISGGRTYGQMEVRPPDIVLVGHILPLGTIAYLLRRRVPYALFLHGLDLLRSEKSWRKRWLGKKILVNAQCIVVNSEYTKRLINGLHINQRPPVTVVYPCPPSESAVKAEEVEMLRRKLGLTGKKVLLTLGRVVERKGHDLVLRALPEILQHVPDAVYVIAGVGLYLEKLGRIVEELKLSAVVRFVGEIPDEERPAYYAMCDLFVMPSRQIGPDVEGFGLAFLEAAMFGKPAIGGKSGGIPEAILDGKTGALVDPNDASALARTVVQLLRDTALRQELGQNAKARTVQEFRWERQVEQLLKLIA